MLNGANLVLSKHSRYLTYKWSFTLLWKHISIVTLENQASSRIFSPHSSTQYHLVCSFSFYHVNLLLLHFKKKISWMWWYIHIIPALWEVKKGQFIVSLGYKRLLKKQRAGVIDGWFSGLRWKAWPELDSPGSTGRKRTKFPSCLDL